MTIDAICVLTVGLVIAGRHPCHLTKRLPLGIADRVVVAMRAVARGAQIRALEIVDVAQFQLLDTLYLIVLDGCIRLINALTQSIGFHSFGFAGFGGRWTTSCRVRCNCALHSIAIAVTIGDRLEGRRRWGYLSLGSDRGPVHGRCA